MTRAILKQFSRGGTTEISLNALAVRGALLRERLTNHLTLRAAARISRRWNRINFQRPERKRRVDEGGSRRASGKEPVERVLRAYERYGFQLSGIVPCKLNYSFRYSTSRPYASRSGRAYFHSRFSRRKFTHSSLFLSFPPIPFLSDENSSESNELAPGRRDTPPCRETTAPS